MVAETDFFPNPRAGRSMAYGSGERAALSVAEGRLAWQRIRAWPGYAPTPLHSLDAIAREVGVGEILYKDEGHRFEVGSFKALGGAYAVAELVRKAATTDITVTAATDGNHGRAVAWGAKRAGCRAVIYVHRDVSPGRADAIAALGAQVRREGSTFDESVRICAAAARTNGWTVVADTSWPGNEEIPRTVTQGYAVLAAEAIEQGARPTHLFLQGGVGGLAAAVLSWFWETQGPARPITTIVEPDAAACLLASARAGRIASVGGTLETIMAGLACGEPSPLAWTILEHGADAFMAIPDSAAADTMRRLARLGVVSGESGVAGLAGLRLAAKEPSWRQALGLGDNARVLCIGSEGATDPAIYRSIVGSTPAEVAARRGA